jgi:carbon starvation protein
LPPEKAAVAPQLIFNQRLDGWLTVLFVGLLWLILADMARVCLRHVRQNTGAMSAQGSA